MRLTDRDLNLFNFLFAFQCLTAIQIAALLDIRSIKICQRRLRKLRRVGYLQKRPLLNTQPGNSPYLYYLGNRAVSFLNVPFSKPKFNLRLSHQQKNTDLMIQIILSFRDSLIKCKVLPEHLIRTANQGKELIPDGVFKLEKEERTALFFLENCAGTEIVKSHNFSNDIENKLIKYLALFKNNDLAYYEKFFGYQFNRFRLLFIANNEQRLKAISELMTEIDKYGFMHLTTIDEFTKQNISSVMWYVPAVDEYKSII